jgi:hypothetical protein
VWCIVRDHPSEIAIEYANRVRSVLDSLGISPQLITGSGRAIDITTTGARPLEQEFDGTAAFQWLSRSARSFGFILSYPLNNRHGYLYEPWHWCYRASAPCDEIPRTP